MPCERFLEVVLEFTQPEGQAQPAEPSQESPSFKQFVIDLLETVVLAIVLFFAINTISARVRVDGSSMLPTLKNGEYVLVNRLAYKMGNLPDYGDIIVFSSPVSDQDLIKRVIGLPGDNVKISGGQVQVNGQILVEPYIAAAPIYDGEWNVPADSLFVLGDNRNDSSDSHAWGLLPVENVIGKAILIYWPPPDWNLIEHLDIAAVLR
jgi:signal peptidase I